MHSSVHVEKNRWKTHEDETVQIADPKSKEVKELVATSASQRNWRGIGIALLVILVVCSLIVTAVVLLTPSSEGPRVKGERITLDDILGDNFTAQRFNGTWISDFEFVFRNEEGHLMLYNATSKDATIFVTDSTIKQAYALDWSLSPDRQFLLLTIDISKVFRYSYLALYKVYEIKTKQFINLTPIEGIHPHLQVASWGPKGNALLMVYENNVYYKPSVHSDQTKQITTTGIPGTVWHGVPDWVYEEEILSSHTAFWFSGDGTMLCYATFNDSQVQVMQIPVYGIESQLYPKMESIRYPKPGLANPLVSLQIVNLVDSEPQVFLHPPPEITKQDHYFTAVQWISNKTVSVIWMNRVQNISVITICSSPLWYCEESYRVESGTEGWVDLYKPPLFSLNGSKYFVILPARDGSNGFFYQVAVVTLPDNKHEFLTHGQGEVTSIKKYDEVGKAVYYISAPEGKPGERHLYRVFENKTNTDKEGVCLTCHLGPDCLYVDATFSSDASYFVLECLGPSTPSVYLYSTRDNKSLAILNANDRVKEFVAAKAFPQIRTFRVSLERNFAAQVRLYLPPGLRDNEVTKYPLVVEVYAGPGSQLVSERFTTGFGVYLSSQRDFIYALIDGRGSGFQGTRLLYEIYRKLGSVEVGDQITVTRYLRDNLHFINGNKIAIWGASYGGYVTGMVTAFDMQVFNCGIAVAPVTNWKYYDTVYTERYMGMPSVLDNDDGYERSNLLTKVSNFKNKKFFLIHGTRDDNVHFQHSMMLTKALVRENILYRMQVYPDENHSLFYVKKHQLEAMEDFLNECFRPEVKTEEIGLQMTPKD